MPCFYPMTGWKTKSGFFLGNKERDGVKTPVPCGGCLGCRKDYAKSWALRCQLEYHEHEHSAWATLTYQEKYVPPTLSKRHLQLWQKRLRAGWSRTGPGAAHPLRIFACGEYGETYGRPHYHAIIFGLPASERSLVETAWGLGRTQTTAVTPAIIAYTAGYTAKKIGWRLQFDGREHVHPETGELFVYQPPFLQMSRRPGIGGNARQHTESWRHFAILNGHKMKVPRFLHNAWKLQATAEQLEQLEQERYENSKNIRKNETPEQHQAAEQHEIKRQQQQKQRPL